MAPGVHHPRPHEEAQADVGKLPVGEPGSAMAELAVAAPDEQLQAPLRGQRVAGCGGTVAPGQGVAKLVEGRAR